MNETIAIVTDSVAGIPRELVKKYNIEVVPIRRSPGETAPDRRDACRC